MATPSPRSPRERSGSAIYVDPAGSKVIFSPDTGLGVAFSDYAPTNAIPEGVAFLDDKENQAPRSIEATKPEKPVGQESDRADAAELELSLLNTLKAVEQAELSAKHTAAKHSAELEGRDRIIESLRARNIELLSEVASWKSGAQRACEQAKEHQRLKIKAQESEAKARKELRQKEEDLLASLAELNDDILVDAKAQVDAAILEKQEAEEKMKAAQNAEREMAAKLEANNDIIDKLILSCGKLSAELGKLEERAHEAEPAKVALDFSPFSMLSSTSSGASRIHSN